MSRHGLATWVALLGVMNCAEAGGGIPDGYRKVAAAYQVPPQVLYLIAQTAAHTRLSNDDAQPWPWVITVDGRTERYTSRLAAVGAFQNYLAEGGHTLAVGLMQLDWRRYRHRFSDPAQAFDPWQNLRLGAAELRHHFRMTGDWSVAAARFSGALTASRLSLDAIDWNNQRRLAATVQRIARHHRVAPALIQAVISAESAFNPRATSKAGAQGLMQLMPATAERMGVQNPYEPAANIDGGTRYLRFLLDTFQTLPLALAAYNAGENAVRRHGYAIPPYPETRAYVPRVLAYYRYFLTQQVTG